MADDKWITWLADMGYGVDFSHDVPPPCRMEDLAAEMVKRGDGDTVDDCVWVIGESTGYWGSDRRG